MARKIVIKLIVAMFFSLTTYYNENLISAVSKTGYGILSEIRNYQNFRTLAGQCLDLMA